MGAWAFTRQIDDELNEIWHDSDLEKINSTLEKILLCNVMA